MKKIKTVSALTRKDWRKWLAKNHKVEKSVQLIIYHKASKKKSIYYDEAVEEALCYGWIDSTGRSRDHESYYQFFAPRKLKSKWSKLNRLRAAKMIRQGLMRASGKAVIDIARKTGTWNTRIESHNAVIPDDLRQLFAKKKTAYKYFNEFPPSSKRVILEWIANAKRPETRKNRIAETVKLASKNIRAHH